MKLINYLIACIATLTFTIDCNAQCFYNSPFNNFENNQTSASKNAYVLDIKTDSAGNVYYLYADYDLTSADTFNLYLKKYTATGQWDNTYPIISSVSNGTAKLELGYKMIGGTKVFTAYVMYQKNISSGNGNRLAFYNTTTSTWDDIIVTATGIPNLYVGAKMKPLDLIWNKVTQELNLLFTCFNPGNSQYFLRLAKYNLTNNNLFYTPLNLTDCDYARMAIEPATGTTYILARFNSSTPSPNLAVLKDDGGGTFNPLSAYFYQYNPTVFDISFTGVNKLVLAYASLSTNEIITSYIIPTIAGTAVIPIDTIKHNTNVFELNFTKDILDTLNNAMYMLTNHNDSVLLYKLDTVNKKWTLEEDEHLAGLGAKIVYSPLTNEPIYAHTGIEKKINNNITNASGLPSISSGFNPVYDYSSGNILGDVPIANYINTEKSLVRKNGNIAYLHTDEYNRLYYQEYDGSSWSTKLYVDSVPELHNGLSIAESKFGALYISHSAFTTPSFLVKEFNGTNFTNIPITAGLLSATELVNEANMALDSIGNLYVFTNSNIVGLSRLIKYDGATWTGGLTGGFNIVTTIAAKHLTLHIAPNGSPVVSFITIGDTMKVQYYDKITNFLYATIKTSVTDGTFQLDSNNNGTVYSINALTGKLELDQYQKLNGLTLISTTLLPALTKSIKAAKDALGNNYVSVFTKTGLGFFNRDTINVFVKEFGSNILTKINVPAYSSLSSKNNDLLLDSNGSVIIINDGWMRQLNSGIVYGNNYSNEIYCNNNLLNQSTTLIGAVAASSKFYYNANGDGQINDLVSNPLSIGTFSIGTQTLAPGSITFLPSNPVNAASYTALFKEQITSMCGAKAFSNTFSVNFNAAPIGIKTTLPNDTICANDTAFLSFTLTSTNTALNYTWNNGANGISNIPFIADFGLTSDTLKLTVEDLKGCTSDFKYGLLAKQISMIKGTVTDQNNLPIFLGEAYIFKVSNTNQTFDTLLNGILSYTPIIFGDYNYQPFLTGNYIMFAQSIDSLITGFNTLMPTYYGGGYVWNDVLNDTITIGCTDTTSVYNIQLRTTNATTTGPGNISGFVTQGPGFGNRFANPGYNQILGIPIKGVGVKLGREPGSNNNVERTGQTNSSGAYSFSNLPLASYKVFVDIPGLPQDSSYTISLTAAQASATNINYIADSISIFIDQTIGFNSKTINNFSLLLYPNPTTNILHIQFSVSTKEQVNLCMVDQNGRVVKHFYQNAILPNGEHSIMFNTDLIKLKNGIYFITGNIGNALLNEAFVKN